MGDTFGISMLSWFNNDLTIPITCSISDFWPNRHPGIPWCSYFRASLCKLLNWELVLGNLEKLPSKQQRLKYYSQTSPYRHLHNTDCQLSPRKNRTCVIFSSNTTSSLIRTLGSESLWCLYERVWQLNFDVRSQQQSAIFIAIGIDILVFLGWALWHDLDDIRSVGLFGVTICVLPILASALHWWGP